ncbi:arylamine N-acetyltransferase family protein [Kitasatospora sp. NPDC054939]
MDLQTTSPGAFDDTQVDAYLARIGLTRPPRADLAGLAALQRAHLHAVPFENLSIHLGEPIVLDPAALFDKVVTRRRGGFCYELNGLFAELLHALGYRVTLLSARVSDRGVLGPPFDHAAVRVDLDEPWLVDVGFGRFSQAPLRLDKRGEQSDGAGVFTLVPHGGADGPADLDIVMNGELQYRLDQRPYALKDFVPTSWYQSTSPASPFARGTTCSLLTPEGRVTINGSRNGTKLVRTTADGGRTEEPLDEAAALAAYRTEFGIALEKLPF